MAIGATTDGGPHAHLEGDADPGRAAGPGQGRRAACARRAASASCRGCTGSVASVQQPSASAGRSSRGRRAPGSARSSRGRRAAGSARSSRGGRSSRGARAAGKARAPGRGLAARSSPSGSCSSAAGRSATTGGCPARTGSRVTRLAPRSWDAHAGHAGEAVVAEITIDARPVLRARSMGHRGRRAARSRATHDEQKREGCTASAALPSEQTTFVGPIGLVHRGRARSRGSRDNSRKRLKKNAVSFPRRKCV